MRAGQLGLPMNLGYIGGPADRLIALADLYREAGRRAGHAASLRVGVGLHYLGTGTEASAAAPAATVDAPILDLASRRSSDSFTDDLLRSRAHLNLLIDSAGTMRPPHRLTTVDGYELQFGVNHLGHFVLTAQLLPLLRAGRADVVTQTSVVAMRAAVNWTDLQWEKRYRPQAAYGRSKVAAGAFGIELQRRFEVGEWGISSDAAHPGAAPAGLLGARPELGRDTEPGLSRAVRTLFRRGILFGDIDLGAVPALLAAVTPGGGQLFGPSGLARLRGPAAEQKPFASIGDSATGRRLWTASEDLTSVRF